MLWLELIRLRTIQDQTERIVSEVEDHLEFIKGEADLIGAKLYRAIKPAGDLSLALLWKCSLMEQRGSLAAQRLILVLREFGLVDHTVWAENDRIGFADFSLLKADLQLKTR